MLYARMIDASIPHGKIILIDTSEAEKLPGVCAVHVIEGVYGVAELRDRAWSPGIGVNPLSTHAQFCIVLR
jgi:CO/xanthine dehydrogenase Mo-binding subunit